MDQPARNALSDLDAALADLAQSSLVAENPTDDWKPLVAWCKLAGRSERQVRRKIKALVESGAWEGRRYRIVTGDKTYPVMHYRRVPQ